MVQDDVFQNSGVALVGCVGARKMRPLSIELAIELQLSSLSHTLNRRSWDTSVITNDLIPLMRWMSPARLLWFISYIDCAVPHRLSVNTGMSALQLWKRRWTCTDSLILDGRQRGRINIIFLSSHVGSNGETRELYQPTFKFKEKVHQH